MMYNRLSEIQNESQDLSPKQLLFLSAWIWSLTFCIDLVYEFKLFDIIAFIGIFSVFRGHILPADWRNHDLTKWSVRFLICGLIGVFITLLRYPDPFWMSVVMLRYYRFVCYVVLSLIITNLRLSQYSLKRLSDTIFFSVLVQAILITLQYLGFLPILWPAYELHEQDFYTGTLGMNHVNSIVFMVVGMAAAVGKLNQIILDRRKRIMIALPLFSLVLMMMSMLIGEARASILALSIFIISIMRNMRGFLVVTGIVLSIIVVNNIAHINVIEQGMYVFNYRLQRKMDVTEENQLVISPDSVDAQRVRIWKTTLYYLINYPDNLILGTGFQNFKNLSRNYKEELPRIVFGDTPLNASSAHNLFLTVLAELGIVGFVILCNWLIAIWRSISVWKSIDRGLYNTLSYPGLTCFLAVLSVAMINEAIYPHRNVPGFMGFFLAYVSIITHSGWLTSVHPEIGKTT